MTTYTPDTWVVLEFTGPSMDTPLRKVFAGWYGGYTGGDSWKLNSGIVKVAKGDSYYEFDGYSGSVYLCKQRDYHMSSLMRAVLDRWTQKATQHGDLNIRILDIAEVALL